MCDRHGLLKVPNIYSFCNVPIFNVKTLMATFSKHDSRKIRKEIWTGNRVLGNKPQTLTVVEVMGVDKIAQRKHLK